MTEGGLDEEREKRGDAAGRLEEDQEEEVDRQSDESFPASDPPSSQPGQV